MSTATEPKRSDEELRHIYRYGWREVTQLRDDGKPYLEHVPLTLEDTLYPELGDHIAEGPMHDTTRMYLGGVFRSRLAHDPEALVLSDCGVYWDHPDHGHHCPDITVITGLPNPQRVMREDSYQIKKFHVFPRMLLEIVSRNLRDNDVVTKFEQYHELQVPLYIIVDRVKSDTDWTIVPYQYTPSHYFRLATDERGRFWIDFLGIWLGVEAGKVVCYDGKTGAIIGDYTEVTRQRDAEKQRAESEKQRAESEKQRADAEAQARLAAETRLRELEAELTRLRSSSTEDTK